jgi:hypothetical protein
MRADEEFLGWGGQGHWLNGWINPVAVVESHLTFALLYQRVIERLAAPPATVELSITFRDGTVGSQRLWLTKYYQLGIQHVSEPRRYTLQDTHAHASLSCNGEDMRSAPQRIAYELLCKFYELFDADPDLIPFTGVDDTGSRFIDETVIRQMR